MTDQTSTVAEPPVHVSFVPTVDDHVRASNQAARPKRRWWPAALLVILSVNLVMRMVREGWDVLFSGTGLGMLFGIGVLVGVLRAPAAARWAMVRHFRQNPELLGPLSYTFSSSGMRAESHLSATEIPWTSLVRVRETPEQFLFYVASSTAYFFPRRALREDDERRLRDMLSAHLGPQAELTNESTAR